MARMLEALRRLEAANRLVLPCAPLAVSVAPPSAPEAIADSDVEFESDASESVCVVDLEDFPFEPAFGPLVSWNRQDVSFAYQSHAIDETFDALDALADDAAESISPTLREPPPIVPVATENLPPIVEPASESPAATPSALDEFDPAQVLREHVGDGTDAVTFVGLSDAPAVAADVLSTIQFAEHWATIALEEFGIHKDEPNEASPDASFSANPTGLAEPLPVVEVAPKPTAKPQSSRPASNDAARPSPSPAELAALLDLNDATLLEQYAQLGQRIVADVTATTKTCAALVSIEHQPHVTDVVLRTAMMISRSGKQVLVIDAALADKQLTSGLGMMIEFGLSEVLKGRVPWQQAVRATATPGLCVLPAGRLAPPRLADDDKRLKDVLKELTSQWDVVLLDGGSLAESSTRYVAAASRNVYLVVRLGETAADAAEQAAKSLASPEIVVRGCIVTNAN